MDLYAYEQLMDKLDEVLSNQEAIKEKLGIVESEDLDDDTEEEDFWKKQGELPPLPF